MPRAGVVFLCSVLYFVAPFFLICVTWEPHFPAAATLAEISDEGRTVLERVMIYKVLLF